MIEIIGVYFSGTGNTKHCVETFVKGYDNNATSISIESPDVCAMISAHDMIVLGYPIYFSNAPKILQDFICANAKEFSGKDIFIIATMGLFSGDGAGCGARLLKKHGANILGGLHLKMPDSIGDEKVLKRADDAILTLISKADSIIAKSVQKMKAGTPTQDGLGFFHHVAGLFGQRLWFYSKTTSYKQAPKVDSSKCIGCRACADLCPMKNIEIIDNKAVSRNQCTLCYRCVNHCPARALTILGKQVHAQYSFERYE